MTEISSQVNQKFNDRTVYFTSLGCSKNLVDAQVMLGHMGLNGFKVETEPQNSEVIVVNTCSFIEAAKQESIEMILDLADYKDEEVGKCKALVVSGCMAQRYSDELEKSLPEVDMFIGTGEYNKIVPLLTALENNKLEKKSFVEVPRFIHTEFDPRLNTSPFYTAWLKISEGCNRNCTFCIIPTLRGRLRSRTVESLVEEAKKLSESGVRELNLISQDLSDYGVDLSDENNLFELLSGLETVDGVDWVRLFYFYPDELTDEVIEKMATSSKVCKYLDMPVQHFSDYVLKRMNRKITGEKIMERIVKLRERIPGIVLRTSIIVGFPGESEQDFEKLLEGVKKARFNHLGIFRYSDEEGTPAYRLKDKNSQEVIDERFDRLYEAQKEIARELNQDFLGQTVEVLVEGTHEDTDLLIVGRHFGQAPDIDGKVIINDLNERDLKIGDLIEVEITEVLDFDLVGRVL
ncbi:MULTISPECIES: 30S ribosomal protein S12 methylthiotransferase RimO [Halobacteriovorax]|uniref:Ribosomal protein uS12 methylthiotransferase RimO n=1 Tax=Halobacteriovorax vibrionivorans TaxID=2152716 RepID=A0ABY0IMZ2_9BACT|nr:MULTISPECIES: 30S ribosomal protein S12 methylthiotransferase RimO [Halobacteriovorax]AYF45829.1 ribosomal protein S12 methylthiotransferase RimO [Halobacteriovorax sp. BALOs_7]RZF22869.1 30S ribosomal protein S12 methylthiotransferase RimO [Halobacteriovorax vibrionivorans]TGD47338.1 30S ribosomal protein S12 methylthiotransferase RimO [Halobacteriovorax sp. Y22]